MSSSVYYSKDSTQIPDPSTMTDPVSISFGVAGILGLAIQLSPIVASYVNGVRHAPENVQNLRQELDALIKTLERLDSFLKSESAKGPAFNELAFLNTTRESCEKRLTAISAKLGTSTEAGRFSQVLRRFTWPLNAENTKAIAQDLSQFSATFHFALSIEGCALLSKTSGEVSQILEPQLEILQKAREVTQAIPDLQSLLATACDRITRVIQLAASSESSKIEGLITDGFSNIEQRIHGRYSRSPSENIYRIPLKSMQAIFTDLTAERNTKDQKLRRGKTFLAAVDESFYRC